MAEMSNAGNLFNKDYTNAVVSLGEEKGMEELVVGFIAQSRVSQVKTYFPKRVSSSYFHCSFERLF